MRTIRLLVVLLVGSSALSLQATPIEFRGMKCPSLLEEIYRQKSQKPGFKPSDHLKLVAPDLNNLNAIKGLPKDFISDLAHARDKLKRKGIPEPMIKMTSVERYSINGQVVDAYVLPDGVVHHMTNPFAKEDSEYLLPVEANCKFNERDLGCIDEEKNIRKKGFCETQRPAEAKDLAPACDAKMVEKYIDTHECLLESKAASCRRLSLSATNRGPLGDLGFALLNSRRPALLEGLQRFHELKRQHRDFSKRLVIEKDDRTTLFEEKRKKLIDEKLKSSDPKLALVIQKLVGKPSWHTLEGALSEMDPEQSRDPQILSAAKKVDQEIAKTYQQEVVAKTVKALMASNSPVLQYYDEQTLKLLIESEDPEKVPVNHKILSAFFGKTGSDFKEIDQLAEKRTEEVYFQKNPGHKQLLATYREGEIIKDIQDELFKEKVRQREILLQSASQEIKILGELYYDYDYTFSKPSGGHIEVVRAPRFKGGAASGILGNLRGAMMEVGLIGVNVLDLERCQAQLGLDKFELEFLKESGKFLSPPKTKSDQVRNPCESMYLVDPQQTINEAKRLYGGITPGLCKVITLEQERLLATIKSSLQDAEASCSSQEIRTNDIRVLVNPERGLHSELSVTRPEGNFLFVSPITQGSNFPEFRYAEVYKLDAQGNRKVDNHLTQKFRQFYKTILEGLGHIGLSSSPEVEEKLGPEKVYEERQRKYNSHMNQIFRAFHESCKGYGNIECEVLRKGLNVTPVIQVTRSVCGADVFEAMICKRESEVLGLRSFIEDSLKIGSAAKPKR